MSKLTSEMLKEAVPFGPETVEWLKRTLEGRPVVIRNAHVVARLFATIESAWEEIEQLYETLDVIISYEHQENAVDHMVRVAKHVLEEK